MKAIFNCSPLIFLVKLEILEKALNLFEDSFIPPEVIEELSKREDKVKEEVSKLCDENQIKLVSYKNLNLFRSLNKRLGKGESSAIVTAIENFSDSGIVILDDYVARKQALDLGLKVKGTLGIMKKLKSLKVIVIEPLDLYEKLINIGFRTKKDIFLKIFEE
jgi:predicted nucleic acid-binding protein